ncbi:MAG: acetoacetate--CoA ligase [Gammaproteobacteria bacterium]|nr:acetoacetate--CoA ligase [Gammaproteobacteria bacterium]
MATLLWQPSKQKIDSAQITAFAKQLGDFSSYEEFHRFSVDSPEVFWPAFWAWAGVKGAPGDVVLSRAPQLMGSQFYPDATLNFAENLLDNNDSDAKALIFWGEAQIKSSMTWGVLKSKVAALAAAFKAAGVTKGDRVVAVLPNMPETIITMLAASSLGAVFSSSSPDFGVQGIVDRFGQIEPKVLVGVDSYLYNGKIHHCAEKMSEVRAQLSTVETFLTVTYTGGDHPAGSIEFEAFAAPYVEAALSFEAVGFNDPLYILFSSGTTGVPKCIVHSVGGVLLKHLVEHRLHTDIGRGDVLFYFTTCGWMMWNWLTTGLASGATLALYDGSPFAKDGDILFDYADAEGFKVLGTSAKFIDALAKANKRPMQTHDLSTVEAILSTGSPLVPESFSYVYEHVKQDVHLASVSGGTDIVGCFVIGVPTLPVYRGQLQAPTLGMATKVWSDDNIEQIEGRGELVCTDPFTSMPIGFWGDQNNEKYSAAYFDQYPGVWCHGDYIERTAEGGYIIHGRSDATLNPGGVRIGTAEIYRQVERLDEVLESIVIGQQWEGDVRVVLFVTLREGVELDEALVIKIKQQIRQNTTPRHVPAVVLQVTDIPRTKSGKLVELAVRNVVHGLPVKNVHALANPEALELFANRPELAS